MADFCNQCAKDFKLPKGDLAGLCEPSMCVDALCESCGPCVVNHLGNCIGLCQREGHKWHRVTQTLFGLEGNCQTAVLASLLNLPIEEVPYFAEGLQFNGVRVEKSDEIFNKRVDDYMESLGYEILWYLDSKATQDFIKNEMFGKPYQVIGKSPRGYYHVVIYQDGEMVHDPHPDFTGVVPEYYGFIFKLGESDE
jgi:hypothetical protein